MHVMSKKIISRWDRNVILRIKEMIDLKPAGQYSIQSLSTKEGINRTKLAFVFKKEFGKSIHQYVIYMRMEKAKKMLTDPDIPIKAIAVECGYKNPKNFSTAFKKFTGKTPANYLSEHCSL